MFDIEITLNAGPLHEGLRRVRGLVSGETAREGMASAVEELTREYLKARDQDGNEHKTAMRLGATPTGFLANQAGFVQAHATAAGVKLTMPAAGLSRAFRPYSLRPIRSRLLTIPLSAQSYGKRAREFSGLKWRSFDEGDVAAGKTDHAGLVLGRPSAEPGGMFEALFAGARHIEQEQDRTILPLDEDWLDEMEKAAWDYLDATA